MPRRPRDLKCTPRLLVTCQNTLVRGLTPRFGWLVHDCYIEVGRRPKNDFVGNKYLKPGIVSKRNTHRFPYYSSLLSRSIQKYMSRVSFS